MNQLVPTYDFYTQAAAALFQIACSEVTKEMRLRVKRHVYWKLYSGGKLGRYNKAREEIANYLSTHSQEST